MRGILQGYAIILLALALNACENRWEQAAAGNEAPQLYLYKAISINESIHTDSVKWSLKYQVPYQFYLKLQDETLKAGSWELMTGAGQLSAITSTEKEQASLQALLIEGKWTLPENSNDSVLSLRYFPQALGRHVLRFSAEDVFGEMAVRELALDVFDNLPPQASLQLVPEKIVNAGHYVLDGSTSFDKDESYGGGLQGYRFEVDGRLIAEGVNSRIEYIFQEAGTKQVLLQVTDSDGALHQTDTLVNIQF